MVGIIESIAIMKVLSFLHIGLIVITFISLVLAKKGKHNSKLFSGLTVLISIICLGISSISGQVQHNEIIETMERQHEEIIVAVNSGFDKTFEERLEQRTDVIFKDDIFLVELEMRSTDDPTWKKTLDVYSGDEIEFQLHYKNNGYGRADNVMVQASLPSYLTYIEDSAILYNSSHQNGLPYEDLTMAAVNIGDYQVYGDAYIRFRVKVQDDDLENGTINRLIVWAKVSAKGEALQDHTQIYVDKINND